MIISIITVCRNSGSVLEKTIKSVTEQTSSSLEYIIIDGNSQDNTQNIIDKYRAYITTYISEPDTGIYNAMNKGIAHATGDYLYFLNADDFLIDENVIEDTIMFLSQNPNIDFLYGDLEVRRIRGDVITVKTPPPSQEALLEEMICGCLPHQASFAHRRVFERIGGFNEAYVIAADYDWFLRLIAATELRLTYYPRVIASYSEGGVSSNLRQSQPEVYRIQNNYPLYQSDCWQAKRIAKYQENILNLRCALEDAISTPSPKNIPINLVKNSHQNLFKDINDLHIHFFTIILNGEPFIRYHIEVFKQLPCKWHWHIVEGVAELTHDTAWSVAMGGEISSEFHEGGLSNDGTTEYLNELATIYPNNVTIYRPPEGRFWDGKREMVNAPLAHITEECLLWQIDGDELWTVEQICKLREMFIKHPLKTAAFYWCWYFVGKKLIITTRYCYSQNPQQEWLRTWRFKPGCVFSSHEPPKLMVMLPEGKEEDIAMINSFSHEETTSAGLIFQHYAYVTPAQLLFKEKYYGYKNALQKWQNLQSHDYFPVFLRDYFPWVKDDTIVGEIDEKKIIPLAQVDGDGKWGFNYDVSTINPSDKPYPLIAVDGVFFKLLKTGIASLWETILEEWVKSGFSKHVLVLDREGTAPKILGIAYRGIPGYNEAKSGGDCELLESVCRQEGVDLFISTYYTTPLTIPAVMLVHDMIPEVIQADLGHSAWREKRLSILYASRYITVSENTARDLVKFYPEIPPEKITTVYNGVKEVYRVASDEEVAGFREKYRIDKPYFMIVGDRTGHNEYKNTSLFFKAFSLLPDSPQFTILCTGGKPRFEQELAQLIPGITPTLVHLGSEEMCAAYTGALALVYPSLYEGFGLPILEAMKCGCPVITCGNSAITEVAGDAVIYTSETEVFELVSAMEKVQDPQVRRQLIEAGLKQGSKFSSSLMARGIAEVLFSYNLDSKSSFLWKELRNLQGYLQEKITEEVQTQLIVKERELNKYKNTVNRIEQDSQARLQEIIKRDEIIQKLREDRLQEIIETDEIIQELRKDVQEFKQQLERGQRRDVVTLMKRIYNKVFKRR